VTGATLNSDQLDALRLIVIESDRRSIETVRRSHFDAVKELHDAACRPIELESGGGTCSGGRAFHHKVVCGVLNGLGGHGARRRAVHRGHARVFAGYLGHWTCSIGARGRDDVDDWRHGHDGLRRRRWLHRLRWLCWARGKLL